MKQVYKALISVLFLLILVTSFPASVLAGERSMVAEFADDTGQIKESDWNKTDDSIICKNGKLIIQGNSATADTKFISKFNCVQDDTIKEMISAEATLQITELPEGETFVIAFGMQGIEAVSGDTGNIETRFVNNGGLKLSVIAYGDDGAVTLVEQKPCGIAFNKSFEFDSTITSQGVQTIRINGRTIWQGQLPTSGEGRFGIIQTGKCGAEFSKLNVRCNYYDRPENTDIFEDFEKGEYNINQLTSTANGTNTSVMSAQIEDYNGSKVFMFRNVGTTWFGTLHSYSNFELSFDVPYFLRQNVYDENGQHLYSPTQRISIGFGEEAASPEIGNEYLSDVDLIDIGSNYLSSRLAQKFVVDLSDKGFFDINSEGDGFSFKLSVIDGKAEVYMKAIKSSQWTLVTETQYEEFRSGYIYLWVTEGATFALDNFKLCNKDTKPKTVEVDYKSSIIKAEDYIQTEEETSLVFRPKEQSESEEQNQIGLPVIIASGCLTIGVIVLVVILTKRKRKRGIEA